ncbi:hypothetical protein N9J10_00670 [Flavobacteriaceae bacterium]|jgi:hypothetical protein|nr:hypothetical protein [Flavobacteriaceae bacterium]MDA9028540.1 hypothetical protein [Flavobacteriaceae bacterium]
MKYLKILITTIVCLTVLTGFINFNNIQSSDVIILKLMGKKLESAYVINDGKEEKFRNGLSGDQALEFFLNEGWSLEGTSVASDAGRFSVVYTLVKN